MKPFKPAVVVIAVLCMLLVANVSHSQEKKPFKISGKVSMPDGSPGSGAIVEVREPKDGGKTIADASGKFALELRPGDYWIQAHVGCYVSPPSIYIHISEDGKVDPKPDIKLSPGAVVTGKLIDKTTGKPVAGAKVMLRYYAETVTDQNGIYLFEVVPQMSHTIAAVKEGFYSPIIHFSTIDRQYVEVPLETMPEGVLKGRITDTEGKPIKGAYIGPSSRDFDFEGTRSNENGEYMLQGLNPETNTKISVSADGYEDIFDKPVIFWSGRRETTMDFKLASTKNDIRTITGRVLRQDKTPIEGAKVAYGHTDCYAGYKTTTTDAEGKFILKDVDNSRSIVTAEASGCAPAFEYVESKIDADIEFIMKPGHRLEGTIVDEDGKPLEGVHIGLDVETDAMTRMGFCGDSLYRWVSPRTKTDNNGRFKLEDLPSKRIFIETTLQGYPYTAPIPLSVDKTDHVLIMKRAGHAAGTVISAIDGKPVSRFVIKSNCDSRPVNVNSPDGTFAYTGWNMETGDKIDLIIEADRYLPSKVFQVEVQPADKNDFKTLKVRLWPTKPVNGIVTTAGSGKPLEDVMVKVFDFERQEGSMWWKGVPQQYSQADTKTGADGKFKVDSAPARIGAVMLEKAGYGRVLMRDVDLYKPVKAVLHKAATIRGIALDDSGKPIAKTRMMVNYRDRAYSSIDMDSMQTGPDGTFTFTGLAPGRYLIQQLNENRTGRLHEATVREGQEYIVDWNRKGQAELECSVLYKGKPASSVHLLVHPLDDPMYVAIGWTDKDGKAVLQVPKTGTYRVTASGGSYGVSDYTEAKTILTLKPGVNKLNMVLPGASVSGKVINQANDKPGIKGQVCAYRKQTEYERLLFSDYLRQHTDPYWTSEKKVEIDDNGSFMINGLDKGLWMFTVKDDKGAIIGTSSVVKVAENEQKQDVVIRMPSLGSAELTVIDAKTGRPAENTAAIMVNETGLATYRDTENRSVGTAEKKDGTVKFTNLLPGKYKVYTQSLKCYPVSTTLEVKTGETTKASLKLPVTSKIIFRLPETEADPFPGKPWIGYKLTKKGSNKPVFEDYMGPYMGGVLWFEPGMPQQAVLPVPPGRYTIEVALRREGDSYSPTAKDNLWSAKLDVTAEQGKYTVIDIPEKIRK